MPREGVERVSPAPFEGGKPGGRGRPGITPPTTGPREGVSPAPFERGKGRGRPSERSPEPGGAGGAAEAGRETPPSPEHGGPPARKMGESPSPGGASGPSNRLEQSESSSPAHVEAQRKNLENADKALDNRGPSGPQGGHRAYAQPGGAPGGGEPAGETRGQRGRMQGAQGQPPPPQRGSGAPGAAEHGQGHGQGHGQPEGGKKRQPRETPPPGPR